MENKSCSRPFVRGSIRLDRFPSIATMVSSGESRPAILLFERAEVVEGILQSLDATELVPLPCERGLKQSSRAAPPRRHNLGALPSSIVLLSFLRPPSTSSPPG
jgi:hypothetical protein